MLKHMHKSLLIYLLIVINYSSLCLWTLPTHVRRSREVAAPTEHTQATAQLRSGTQRILKSFLVP